MVCVRNETCQVWYCAYVISATIGSWPKPAVALTISLPVDDPVQQQWSFNIIVDFCYEPTVLCLLSLPGNPPDHDRPPLITAD